MSTRAKAIDLMAIDDSALLIGYRFCVAMPKHTAQPLLKKTELKKSSESRKVTLKK